MGIRGVGTALTGFATVTWARAPTQELRVYMLHPEAGANMPQLGARQIWDAGCRRGLRRQDNMEGFTE